MRLIVIVDVDESELPSDHADRPVEENVSELVEGLEGIHVTTVNNPRTGYSTAEQATRREGHGVK